MRRGKDYLSTIISESLNKALRKTLSNMVTESSSYDMSTVGSVNYSCNFDEDYYNDWLEENDETDTKETKLQYYKEEVNFEIEYLDNEYFHTMGYEDMMFDELVDEFGEKTANRILIDCMEDGKGSFETYELYEDEVVDINNPDSLNSIAVKLLQSGQYYKDCRGFILTNGTVVYTPNEHNQCTIIDGIKNTFHFIHLGNIRVLDHSIDLSTQPTPQQRSVLMKVIASYANEELYLDILDNKNGQVGVKYVNPRWQRVLSDIDRYFDEGLRPRGDMR